MYFLSISLQISVRVCLLQISSSFSPSKSIFTRFALQNGVSFPFYLLLYYFPTTHEEIIWHYFKNSIRDSKMGRNFFMPSAHFSSWCINFSRFFWIIQANLGYYSSHVQVQMIASKIPRNRRCFFCFYVISLVNFHHFFYRCGKTSIEEK